MSYSSRGAAPTAPNAISELDQLIVARRAAMAEQAAQIYARTRSLRGTAAQMKVSHEHVRSLLLEAGIEADGKHGPRTAEVLQ